MIVHMFKLILVISREDRLTIFIHDLHTQCLNNLTTRPFSARLLIIHIPKTIPKINDLHMTKSQQQSSEYRMKQRVR